MSTSFALTQTELIRLTTETDRAWRFYHRGGNVPLSAQIKTYLRKKGFDCTSEEIEEILKSRNRAFIGRSDLAQIRLNLQTERKEKGETRIAVSQETLREKLKAAGARVDRPTIIKIRDDLAAVGITLTQVAPTEKTATIQAALYTSYLTVLKNLRKKGIFSRKPGRKEIIEEFLTHHRSVWHVASSIKRVMRDMTLAGNKTVTVRTSGKIERRDIVESTYHVLCREEKRPPTLMELQKKIFESHRIALSISTIKSILYIINDKLPRWRPTLRCAFPGRTTSLTIPIAEAYQTLVAKKRPISSADLIKALSERTPPVIITVSELNNVFDGLRKRGISFPLTTAKYNYAAVRIAYNRATAIVGTPTIPEVRYLYSLITGEEISRDALQLFIIKERRMGVSLPYVEIRGQNRLRTILPMIEPLLITEGFEQDFFTLPDHARTAFLGAVSGNKHLERAVDALSKSPTIKSKDCFHLLHALARCENDVAQETLHVVSKEYLTCIPSLAPMVRELQRRIDGVKDFSCTVPKQAQVVGEVSTRSLLNMATTRAESLHKKAIPLGQQRRISAAWLTAKALQEIVLLMRKR